MTTIDEPRVPSRQVLSELPLRVVVFLRAIADHAEIRGALERGGYSEVEHREALRWLGAALESSDFGASVHSDQRARLAAEELEAWWGQHRQRLALALQRLHPAYHHVLSGTELTHPNGAVLSVATLLEHLDALEQGTTSASEERAVLRTFTRRGLGAEERKRLQGLVHAAQAATAAPPDGGKEARREALLALHAWYADWAATARSLIRRKDHLVVLGLSARRRIRPQPFSHSRSLEPEA